MVEVARTWHSLSIYCLFPRTALLQSLIELGDEFTMLYMKSPYNKHNLSRSNISSGSFRIRVSIDMGISVYSGHIMALDLHDTYLCNIRTRHSQVMDRIYPRGFRTDCGPFLFLKVAHGPVWKCAVKCPNWSIFKDV